MTCDELQQLTALEALGALDGADVDRLRERLAGDPAARAELGRFIDVADALAAAVPQQKPSPTVRARILDRIRLHPQLPNLKPGASAGASRAGIRFVTSDAPWLPAPLPGARFKLLSSAPDQGYALLLIDLPPGTIYPEHDHEGTEEMFILSGDLQSEGRSLGPGDLLHGEPGSHHHDLRTITGCRALMVVPVSALALLASA